jgi:predicted 2-oxoglutarate/Fe(II)-dependent dioxygenase YbiX
VDILVIDDKIEQKLHPDKGGEHETFVKLTQAYHDLLKTKK